MMLRAPQAQSTATLLIRHSPSRQATASSTTTLHHRTFASIPHHLARQNNGMVNVFVKSTKVPRPRIIKTFNRLKPLPPPAAAAAAAPNNPNVPSSLNGDDMKNGVNGVLTNETTITSAAAADVKEEHLSYAGNINIPITSQLKIVMPGVDDSPRGIWPVFRMMDESGNFLQPDSSHHATNAAVVGHYNNNTKVNDLNQLQLTLSNQYPHYKHEFMSSGLFRPSKNAYPDMTMTTKPAAGATSTNEEATVAEESYTKNTLLRAHRQMIRLRKMDTILHNAQRQGRISFYMTHHGEEAIHMGSASALSPHDTIFAQYREAGLLMWRGFTLDQFCNQCFSNEMDLGKGRQMPVHYGCRALNYQTVSSPLGTQLTQAVGAAYKFKLDAMKSKESGSSTDEEKRISIVYFGEGAASTIDFHSACNFAATLKTPMIFFCRNNGYAISTPVEDQYAGDGIISRAPGYGMAGIRVDGNDIFAVHAAVAKARKVALETSAPVMIEAMTYRQGHHSTSDDSSRYRAVDEVTTAQDVTDPILRMDRFLRQYGWLDDNAVATIEDEERVAVLRAMEGAESRSDPKLDTMFTDVYDEKPPHLIRQEMELVAHLKRHNIAHD